MTVRSHDFIVDFQFSPLLSKTQRWCICDGEPFSPSLMIVAEEAIHL